jgi:hypothetical protein
VTKYSQLKPNTTGWYNVEPQEILMLFTRSNFIARKLVWIFCRGQRNHMLLFFCATVNRWKYMNDVSEPYFEALTEEIRSTSL